MFGDFDLVVFLRDFFRELGLSNRLSVFPETVIIVLIVGVLSWLSFMNLGSGYSRILQAMISNY